MRTLLVSLSLLTASVGLVGLAAPAQAAPPADYGNGCTAEQAPANSTVLMTARSAANALPIAAPATGVVTRATFAVPAMTSSFPTVLKSLRPAGPANQFTVVAQSAVLQVPGGLSSHALRMPVTAGDLLGLSGGLGSLICATANGGDVIGTATGDIGVGQTATFSPTTGRAVPVVVTVEPDVDKDGFGDVTQDLCPQSPALQTACPVVRVDTIGASSGRTVTLVVTVDHAATVNVTGRTTVKGKTVTLPGGAMSIGPGALVTFTVKVPAQLRAALDHLSPRRHVTVTLTASATDLVGRVSTDTSTVRLAGTHR